MSGTMRVAIDDKALMKYIRDKKAAEIREKRRLLRLMGAHMMRSTAMNFRAQGRDDHTTNLWPMLKVSTIKGRKKGQRISPKILQASGRLKKSITYEVRGKKLGVGTNVEYGKYHQQAGAFGTMLGNLPSRPFLRFQPKDLDWFKKLIDKTMSD